MSGQQYWDAGADAFRRQHLGNPYASSAITYEAPIYTSNEAAYGATEPYHVAPPRDATYAYRPSDIAVPASMARGPSYERDASSWDSAPQSGYGGFQARVSSTSDVGTLDGQHVWRNAHHYEHRIETPLQLPLTPVTAGSSDVDLEGQSRRSAAGKERKKASTVTRKCRPASCTPCRTKKMRCSRSKPCTACVNRGDPEGCVWEG